MKLHRRLSGTGDPLRAGGRLEERKRSGSPRIRENEAPESRSFPKTRKILVVTCGFSVLLLGIVMLITPGPAIVVIPGGLGILALEFAWARRVLGRLKRAASRVGSAGADAEDAEPRR